MNTKRKTRYAKLRADTVELTRGKNDLTLTDYDGNAGKSKQVSIALDHGTVRALAGALNEWLLEQESQSVQTRRYLVKE